MARAEIALLLSIGRHPASGRPRAADGDGRALRLALSLGMPVQACHAGPFDEGSLRLYLGQGLTSLTLLEIAADADPMPALIRHLRALRPDLILAGRRAEDGESSGMVPYLVANALGAAIVPGILSLTIEGAGAAVVQALPHGRRRALHAAFPLVATVDRRALPAPQAAFGRGRRGVITRVPSQAPLDQARSEHTEHEARPRARGLARASGLELADRLAALTAGRAADGKVLVNVSPVGAAAAILQYLADNQLIPETLSRREKDEPPLDSK